jgi:hypothetical protein
MKRRFKPALITVLLLVPSGYLSIMAIRSLMGVIA